MLARLLRFAPLAVAGWRMYQNYRRRNGQTQQGRSTQGRPPVSTDEYGNNPRA